jgi:hypothetical protein
VIYLSIEEHEPRGTQSYTGKPTGLDQSVSNSEVTTKAESTVQKAADPDLEVGLICADRDGNRIRIDRVDRIAGLLSYHFLNDELRVQEGIQDRSIMQFLAEGWYRAAPGKSL